MPIVRVNVGGIGQTGGLSFEEPHVARYLTIADSGFAIPDPSFPVSDVHLQQIHAPGLVPGIPAVIFFRTQHRAGSTFQLRLNATPLFRHRADADGAQAWHEIVQPGALRPQDNELTLSVDPRGSVLFSDIVILYTSNQLTVTREAVLSPN